MEMDTSYVDISDLDSLNVESQLEDLEYPTPAASSEAGQTVKSEEPNKKKRKAWGQPVPDIVPILPPRKRAKTAEEKEQRKNERILRNRRAADKSRQRQKAAQADLEQQNKDLLVENAKLKALLSQHGITGEFKSFPQINTPPASVTGGTPSICDFDSLHEQSHLSLSSSHNDELAPMPDLSPDSTSISHTLPSPTLAPTLELGKDNTVLSTLPVSGMTQYPAAILCDLQCQPEVLESKLRWCQTPNSMLETVLTFLHYLTIVKSSSTSMLSPMARLFQMLESILGAATPSSTLASLVASNFQLIHILISLPSTPTQPAVFRLKLLSRLLACNPSLAPLLKTAADSALQQNLDVENWPAKADSRWAVSSLMTIKWSINWLEHEHARLRLQLRNGRLDRDSLFEKEKVGVDCAAVEKNYRLFDDLDPRPYTQVATSHSTNIGGSECMAPLEVH